MIQKNLTAEHIPVMHDIVLCACGIAQSDCDYHAAPHIPKIGDSLSWVFADAVALQWRRLFPFESTLRAEGDIGDGRGKNVYFEPWESPGEKIFAVLPWATYRSSFQISETELDCIREVDCNSDLLAGLLGDRILGAAFQNQRKISRDMMMGQGVDPHGNPTIIGLFDGALATSGAYADINTATWERWASNALGNGGVPRPLTPRLIDSAEGLIFDRCSEMWDAMIVEAGIARKYDGFFTHTGPPPCNYANRFYRGKAVVRHPYLNHGQMALLNTSHIKFKFLPSISKNEKAASVKTLADVPMRIAVLANAGESIRIGLICTLQMFVEHPASCARIVDIDDR
jgi:hypothetical protein